MKIAVMGTGAIGGYIGARLTAGGAVVTFIARGPHLAAIRKDGLKILSPLGDLLVAPASATDDPGAVGPVDAVLLATKLYDVEAAARAIGPMLGRETAVVCLQNGVDATDIVAGLHGRPRVVGGVVVINGEVVAPGVIRHNALNRLTLGELDGRESARLTRLVALTRAAGIDAVLSTDIRLEIWRKLMVLAPMAALSAMTRVPLARLRAHEETWRLAEQGMREVAAVARAQGVGLTEEDVESALAFVQGMPATWRASLAVDLEQGRRLEIDGLAGAVVRRGQTAGIETPFHRVALGVLKPHAAGAV
ncbi:MAG TPA: 2-dehydropantoate 2-reductase [Methylomirabilota bacterium]|nr:2-dehydropantoate 2-reductase [Methylomirabilota bacterium]